MSFTPLFDDPLEHVVCHSPDEEKYIGSPSIAQLPSGDLLFSHDFFGRKAPHDPWGREYLSHVHRSSDGGATWELIAEVPYAYWSTIFVHNGAAYLFGPSAQYGDLVIRRSEDGGRTWTTPVDEKSGLLIRGGEGWKPPCFHSSSVPVLFHQGRIWRAVENNPGRKWPQDFRAVVLSAPIDSDWLRAENWSVTPDLKYDPSGNPPGFTERSGWLEGNVVADRQGQLWNILRVASFPEVNWCAHVRIHPDTMTLSFDPKTGFHRLPGGFTKFTIRFDPVADLYWTVSNESILEHNPQHRNFLILASSYDLKTWERRCVLLYKEEDKSLVGSQSKIGFQYVDWIIDGDDMLLAIRTAFNGAHNFHDANYATFHRVKNFRSL